MITDKELYELAHQATFRSYAPFSKFYVGAALLGKDGKVYTGCNIENSSLGGTICAERTAMVKAISEGCTEFEKLMVIERNGEAWPCGICRQFIREFVDNDFIIMTAADADHIRYYTMDEILPEGFKANFDDRK